MRMEPFDAYRYYQALKLHFESDTYDATKYNYKTSAKQQSFWKRRDKFHFAKIGRMFDSPPELINYYAAHFVAGNNWVGDMLNNEQQHKDQLKRMESLGYVFEQDLLRLNEECQSFDSIFDIGNQYPIVIESYLSDDINIESVVILNQLTQFMRKADKNITETIVWPDVSRKIHKYSPFIRVDLKKMKKSVLKVFTS